MGTDMASVAQAAKVVRVECEGAHPSEVTPHTDWPNMVHFLCLLVEDASGHAILTEWMLGDVCRA